MSDLEAPRPLVATIKVVGVERYEGTIARVEAELPDYIIGPVGGKMQAAGITIAYLVHQDDAPRIGDSIRVTWEVMP